MSDITREQLLERYAQIQNIAVEEAQSQFDKGATVDDILAQIKTANLKKIQEQMPPMNRAQRRAMAKKLGKKNMSKAELITETAAKLNYIDLIQKFRALNEKESQNNEESTQDN